MTRCNRPECGRGVIDEQGFCTECALRPLPAPETIAHPVTDRDTPRGAGRSASATVAASNTSATATVAATTVKIAGITPAATTAATTGINAAIGASQVRPEPWWGLDLVTDSQAPTAPVTAPRGGAYLSEEQRYCANRECLRPVGRGHDGNPGRLRGYCAACGTEFDFSRPVAGQVIAARYEVKEVLEAGGQGMTLLAHDRNLDTSVVLKALRESVAVTALAERDALVGLRHDSIVRILNYELEGPYLVLEFVPGPRLAARPDDPLEVILAHGLRVLQALDYLHLRGLLHCDVKPANIIRFAEVTPVNVRDRVRLIDFGAVRRIDDESPVTVYTARYAPPQWNEQTQQPDPEHLRPTEGFDLFCLGKTLAELCARYTRDQSSAPGVDSLRRLLARATDVDLPQRRFTSARQCAEQVSGVIRQVVAASHTHRRVVRASVLFGSMAAPLHGGLGAPRPLTHWITARVSDDRVLEISPPFTTPSPEQVVAALPTPLADPDERDTDAARAAQRALSECRGALLQGSVDAAQQALERSGLPSWHWLYSWYAGLTSLARWDVVTASRWFSTVRDMLPGELIPSLALGLCAESKGDLTIARLHYETVANTAPALSAASYGLARVHLVAGRRGEAVETTQRLALQFRFEREPWIALVRLLVAVVDSPAATPPTAADLASARELLEELNVDAAARTALRAEIQYARFATGGDGLELSELMREVAGQVPTEREFVAMIDLANRLRPPIEWRWPRSARWARGTG